MDSSPDVATWRTDEVARMSGTTSRTLRHYDAVGLLSPVGTGPGGTRLYGRLELLRLQRILLLRELGVGLDAIGSVLDGETSQADALRQHRTALQQEQRRLDRLVDTVTRTIRSLEGGHDMRPDDLFDGFDAEQQAADEQALVERYGEPARAGIEESRRHMSSWTRADADDVMAEAARIGKHLAALIDDGVASDDPHTLDVVADHYAWVSRFWTPTAEAYAGLGELYAEDARFRAFYAEQHPGMADFMRDAMAAYAEQRMS